jgi:hypothetical protein
MREDAQTLLADPSQQILRDRTPEV